MQEKVRRRGFRLSYFLAALAACGLSALATWASPLDRGALWGVVRACIADKNLTGSPFPCLDIDLTGGEQRGYVVLREPFTHEMILAPTQRIIGVEDPLLYARHAPNYFDAAWRAHSFLRGPDGKPPDRERVVLAVNSAVVRSQDQLHIHIGCLVPAAEASVRSIAPRLQPGEWAQVGPIIPHSMFWGLLIPATDLTAVKPLALAADYLADKVRDRAKIMVAVAGVRVAGNDGFVILASYDHAPRAWWPVAAENILDSTCSAAPGQSRGGIGLEPDAAGSDERKHRGWDYNVRLALMGGASLNPSARDRIIPLAAAEAPNGDRNPCARRAVLASLHERLALKMKSRSRHWLKATKLVAHEKRRSAPTATRAG